MIFLHLLTKGGALRHFCGIDPSSAAQETIAHAASAIRCDVIVRAPSVLATSFGPLSDVSARLGHDVQETSAKLGGDDHVEEKIGGRTNGVEEVREPAEIIQFVGVQHLEFWGAPECKETPSSNSWEYEDEKYGDVTSCEK